MALVAGSYERFIWGFSLKTLKPLSGQNSTAPDGAQDGGGGGNGGHVLKPLFSYPSHAGSIKCVAVSGPVAVSGGSDDAVKIYDLSSCAEVGSLTDQGGAVTAVALYAPPSLPSPRNLVTGSDAGVVSIYDADPFVHLKSVRRVHRKGAGVADLALHPSGRLALTVGRGDASLAMVSLVRGRRSFACRLEKEASVLRYGLGDGDVFFMAAEETVSVHNSEDARLVAELVGQKKVLCVAPGENGVLLAGGEDRNVTAWDISSGKVAYCIEGAHSARVKGLVVLGSRSSAQSSDAPYLLASASSDGVIRLWDIRMVSKNQNYLAEANTKSRLTCLAGSSIKLATVCNKPSLAGAGMRDLRRGVGTMDALLLLLVADIIEILLAFLVGKKKSSGSSASSGLLFSFISVDLFLAGDISFTTTASATSFWWLSGGSGLAVSGFLLGDECGSRSCCCFCSWFSAILVSTCCLASFLSISSCASNSFTRNKGSIAFTRLLINEDRCFFLGSNLSIICLYFFHEVNI